jgi:hypothetical protein
MTLNHYIGIAAAILLALVIVAACSRINDDEGDE